MVCTSRVENSAQGLSCQL
jgi:Sterile alpha motif (SAM)/Pointed domain